MNVRCEHLSGRHDVLLQESSLLMKVLYFRQTVRSPCLSPSVNARDGSECSRCGPGSSSWAAAQEMPSLHWPALAQSTGSWWQLWTAPSHAP